MMNISFLCLVLSVLSLNGLHAFTGQIGPSRTPSCTTTSTSSTRLNASTETTTTQKDNKAMSFLRKIGKVGGTKVDFTNAVGVDEGSGGAKISTNSGKCGHDIAMEKAKHAYRSCADSGTIDDLSETFPITSSGTQWAGVTDKLIGGTSSATLVREDFQGRVSNVLRAKVRLDDEDNGGFVQMVTDLALDHSVSNTVDASEYDGVEFDVFYRGKADKESFNVHLKDTNCMRQFSSYRATFEVPQGEWTTVRLPWSTFDGFGLGAVHLLENSALRRIGLVAIGKKMDATLALSSIRFIQQQD